MTRADLSPPTITDLVTALIEGPFEDPLWSTFLQKLKTDTNADFVLFILRPPGRPMDDGYQLAAGIEDLPAIRQIYRDHFGPLHSAGQGWSGGLKPLGREAVHRDTIAHEAFYSELKTRFQIRHMLQVRVNEENGVDGSLTLASSLTPFDASASRLLDALARPVRGMLANYVAHEKDRVKSILANEAVRRMQCGWILMDAAGYVLATDAFGQACLDQSGVISTSRRGKIRLRTKDVEADVLQIVASMALDPQVRPQAISLCGDPWLDMLLLPARRNMLTEDAAPAVIGYVHGDNWKSSDRCGQLIDLFGLSRNEAQLALAICRGKTIAEAGAQIGLSIATARSYSKSIYAKTGARGSADLVRIIMGSVLALAPDP